ncbi:MAG: DUF6503 family protein [Chitinophagales bacterium]
MQKQKSGLSYFLVLFLFVACQNNPEESHNAQKIVDKAIEKSGTQAFANAKVRFDFRDKSYKSIGQCGQMTLERISNDSSATIRDVLSPTGFRRLKNGATQQIPDTMAAKYSASVNSVHYFVQLPWRLNDEAVNKKYLGEENINNKKYHLLQVTFDQEGGGEDFEDIYLYWIQTDSFTVDYLAYSFETNVGGMRFREAFNPRYIEGIRFVDYNNYKPLTKDVALLELAQKFDSDELKLLSEIITENVKVELLDSECP